MADPLLAVLACLVIGISDGDTLTARCSTPMGERNLKVRLAEIDAPESHQAFGQRSRQHLAVLCFRKNALVKPKTVDRYRCVVARVACDGVDASVEQVRAGMAWAFLSYLDDAAIVKVEAEARVDRRGLWRDSEPVAPWGVARSTQASRPTAVGLPEALQAPATREHRQP